MEKESEKISLNKFLLFICGCTGSGLSPLLSFFLFFFLLYLFELLLVGKSSAAITIGKYYKGEIINSDSLQLYKG